MNVDEDLATTLAEQLGMAKAPAPLPRAGASRPEVEESPALSLLARPGAVGIRTRRIAILVADGVDIEMASRLHGQLAAAAAVPRFVGIRLGKVSSEQGMELPVEVTLEAMPSVLWDALVIPDGREASVTLGNVGQALEFVKDQYRHCKPILALGAGVDLVENAGVPMRLPNGDADPGLSVARDVDEESACLDAFIAALAAHRVFDRELDPPAV
jgi:catalase